MVQLYMNTDYIRALPLARKYLYITYSTVQGSINI